MAPPFTVPCVKDMKLGKYTIPTGNRTPGRRVAVHYATAESKHIVVCDGSYTMRFFHMIGPDSSEWATENLLDGSIIAYILSP